MNAYPLTRPNGQVHAWACGVCGGAGGSGGVTLTEEGRRHFVDLDHSKAAAERCCRCHTCKVAQASMGFSTECPGCKARSDAKAAEERAAAVALTETSVPAPEAEHYEMAACGDRVVIEVERDEDRGICNTATVRYRPEGRPEHNRDFRAMSRSTAGAVLEVALASLHLVGDGDDVPTLRRAPEPFDFGDDFAGVLAFVMAVETPRDAAALITADTLATYLRARAWEPADAEPWPWGAAWRPPASGGVVAYVAPDESESAPDVVRLDCGAVGVVEGRAAEMVLAELLVAQWRTGGFRAGGTT